MKTVQATVEALKITETNLYKNDYIRPFIQTYLSNPLLYKGKFPFKILHNYSFGPDNEYKDYKHTYVFVGYRWLTRKFIPFFISLTNYDEGFDVTGFSTYDSTHTWYNEYIDLGFIENKPVYIRKDRDFDNCPSLDKQIKVMGQTVLKHLNVRLKKK